MAVRGDEVGMSGLERRVDLAGLREAVERLRDVVR